jgi:hypothetical protein
VPLLNQARSHLLSMDRDILRGRNAKSHATATRTFNDFDHNVSPDENPLTFPST